MRRMDDVAPKKTIEALEDIASSVTRDALVTYRQKFNFPKDLTIMAPDDSSRVNAPPSGYVAVYEMSLRAGLRFPPAPELVEVCRAYGVALSQLSHRMLVTIMGLIVFFRERRAVFRTKYLSSICRFSQDPLGRVLCRSNRKWLDLMTGYPPKSWVNGFFFVKNDWAFPEKWGRLKDGLGRIHVEDGEILKALDIQNVERLQFELFHIDKFVAEERLFKSGLSIQAGRSDAHPVKRSSRDRAVSSNVEDISSSSGRKKKRLDDQAAVGSLDEGSKEGTKTPVLVDDIIVLEPVAAGGSLKVHVPEGLLKHKCSGRRQSVEFELALRKLLDDWSKPLDDWNSEYVRVKFMKDEYGRRLTAKDSDMLSLETQLVACRAELATLSTSLSLQNREVDSTRMNLDDARSDVREQKKEIAALTLERNSFKEEKESMANLLIQKEAEIEARVEAALARGRDDYKSSMAYNRDIQEHLGRARKEIYDLEVKGLKRQCYQEGFARGFLKGVHLVQQKTGANVEDLSLSQTSPDPYSDSEDEVEHELQKAFDSDEDVIVD